MKSRPDTSAARNESGNSRRMPLLIITADDLGRDRLATGACMECFRQRRITSASVMVFMHDSERAARLAVEENLETGLHLNLVLPYDSADVPERMKRDHRSAVRFFRAGPWTQAVYNPFIVKSIASVFNAQLDEYRRLFGQDPAFFNGHKHFHLSLNMIFGKVLPPGSAVRRSFTFAKGEKSALNRSFRRIVDTWLQKRHITTDSFFSLSPLDDIPRLTRILNLARRSSVELMAHPWRLNESAFLTGKEFAGLIAGVCLGDFTSLKSKEDRRFGPTGDPP
jgi:predicted glycoside hydrolase/deacetylase ChbG (UPF0249 family)